MTYPKDSSATQLCRTRFLPGCWRRKTLLIHQFWIGGSRDYKPSFITAISDVILDRVSVPVQGVPVIVDLYSHQLISAVLGFAKLIQNWWAPSIQSVRTEVYLFEQMNQIYDVLDQTRSGINDSKSEKQDVLKHLVVIEPSVSKCKWTGDICMHATQVWPAWSLQLHSVILINHHGSWTWLQRQIRQVISAKTHSLRYPRCKTYATLQV